MKRKTPQENTARVIALALGLFATLLTLGVVDGVFAKLSPETLAALAVFAIGYAIATYLLDRQVRAFVDRVLGRGKGHPLAPDVQARPAVRRAVRRDVPRSGAIAQ
jgi:ABC-type protease/lipase transport system fused ATPase/permease subunit